MKITLMGKPIPKARAKYAAMGKFHKVYDPQHAIKEQTKKNLIKILDEKRETELEASVLVRMLGKKMEIEMEASATPYNEAINVRLSFYMPIADSASQATRGAFLWGLRSHTSKPDLDNLEKFILDCGNKVLWKDDSQIVSLSSKKIYSLMPRTEIEIMSAKKKSCGKPAETVLGVFHPDILKDFFFDLTALLQYKDMLLNGQLSPDGCEYYMPPDWAEDLAMKLAALGNRWGDRLRHISKYHGNEKLAEEAYKGYEEG